MLLRCLLPVFSGAAVALVIHDESHEGVVCQPILPDRPQPLLSGFAPFLADQCRLSPARVLSCPSAVDAVSLRSSWCSRSRPSRSSGFDALPSDDLPEFENLLECSGIREGLAGSRSFGVRSAAAFSHFQINEAGAEQDQHLFVRPPTTPFFSILSSPLFFLNPLASFVPADVCRIPLYL